MDEQLLIRFLTHTCTPEDLRSIDQWIASGKPNADWLFEMERIWSLKDELRFSDRREIEEAYNRKVCRNTRCAFFFFVDYKNRLIFLSCDILRISLIYVFAASKYSYCKLIKQSSQPIHTFFSHFCTYLFYIEGNGKEGKVHEDLVLSKMAETFVIHIVFHLSEHGFRFYASLSSVFQPFLGAELLFGFLPVFSEPVIQFYRPVSFCFKTTAS